MNSLTLQELNNTVKSVLKKELASSYWVVAEIGGITINATGHCYLELIEKTGQQVLAKSNATIWANTYTNLSLWFEKMTGSELKTGMKILCNATVQYHEVYGLSLNIHDIDASFTIGEKEANRQKTINQLTEEGVLTMNKELPINLVLQNIAVISSSTAAGYEDFTNHLKSNSFGYKFSLKLYDAVMQGSTSALSITKALHKVYESDILYDIVVIIRGGGSKIDLDSYDTYELATHIAQFPMPIITGIGHDRDESVVDIVAHKALKTPTAVAEYIINESAYYEHNFIENFEKINILAKQSISAQKQALVQLGIELTHVSKSLVLTKHHIFSNLTDKLRHVTKHYMNNQKSCITSLQHNLEILSPENVLKRGYSMTISKGKLLTKNTKLKNGEQLITETLDHIIHSTVTLQKHKL